MRPVSESIKFAIDTNIVSAFFKGEPDEVAEVVRFLDEENLLR